MANMLVDSDSYEFREGTLKDVYNDTIIKCGQTFELFQIAPNESPHEFSYDTTPILSKVVHLPIPIVVANYSAIRIEQVAHGFTTNLNKDSGLGNIYFIDASGNRYGQLKNYGYVKTPAPAPPPYSGDMAFYIRSSVFGANISVANDLSVEYGYQEYTGSQSDVATSVSDGNFLPPIIDGIEFRYELSEGETFKTYGLYVTVSGIA